MSFFLCGVIWNLLVCLRHPRGVAPPDVGEVSLGFRASVLSAAKLDTDALLTPPRRAWCRTPRRAPSREKRLPPVFGCMALPADARHAPQAPSAGHGLVSSRHEAGFPHAQERTSPDNG